MIRLCVGACNREVPAARFEDRFHVSLEAARKPKATRVNSEGVLSPRLSDG